jgi:hypothetical protein
VTRLTRHTDMVRLELAKSIASFKSFTMNKMNRLKLLKL